MNKINIILFLFISAFSFAQNDSDSVDKLTNEMCLSFKNNESLSDSLRITILNEKFIFPYLSQFPETEQEPLVDKLYFRFQKNCKEFVDYLYRIDPPKKDDWIKLDTRPDIKITKKELDFLKRKQNFYYFEWDGEKTTVKITNKYWTETFSDGTYSKLYFRWLASNQFELEFIESNNNGRKNFSKLGDKYVYEIVSKENDHYWILVTISGQSELFMFKLFL
ncbi:MAG: hypothetical protein E2590_11345 [Chryseobacterium sp.]|nr:hypothetical protein [Chryseobacterium sp.]